MTTAPIRWPVARRIAVGAGALVATGLVAVLLQPPSTYSTPISHVEDLGCTAETPQESITTIEVTYVMACPRPLHSVEVIRQDHEGVEIEVWVDGAPCAEWEDPIPGSFFYEDSTTIDLDERLAYRDVWSDGVRVEQRIPAYDGASVKVFPFVPGFAGTGAATEVLEKIDDGSHDLNIEVVDGLPAGAESMADMALYFDTDCLFQEAWIAVVQREDLSAVFDISSVLFDFDNHPILDVPGFRAAIPDDEWDAGVEPTSERRVAIPDPVTGDYLVLFGTERADTYISAGLEAVEAFLQARLATTP